MTLIIVLVILLICSLVFNYFLFRAGQDHMEKADLYEDWIIEFSQDVESTLENIREIDSRQMFEKDDDVGVIFQQIVDLIDKLNNRTQNVEEIEPEGVIEIV